MRAGRAQYGSRRSRKRLQQTRSAAGGAPDRAKDAAALAPRVHRLDEAPLHRRALLGRDQLRARAQRREARGLRVGLLLEVGDLRAQLVGGQAVVPAAELCRVLEVRGGVGACGASEH